MEYLSIEYEVGDFVKLRTKEWVKKNYTKKDNSNCYMFTYDNIISSTIDEDELELLGKVGKIVGKKQNPKIGKCSKDTLLYSKFIYDILIKTDNEEKIISITNLNIIVPIYYPSISLIYKYCLNYCIYSKCKETCKFYNIFNYES